MMIRPRGSYFQGIKPRIGLWNGRCSTRAAAGRHSATTGGPHGAKGAGPPRLRARGCGPILPPRPPRAGHTGRPWRTATVPQQLPPPPPPLQQPPTPPDLATSPARPRRPRPPAAVWVTPGSRPHSPLMPRASPATLACRWSAPGSGSGSHLLVAMGTPCQTAASPSKLNNPLVFQWEGGEGFSKDDSRIDHYH